MMMLHSKSIGNKIVAARKKIQLSQAELAQKVSISSQAVGKWERGESMPDISTLNRLAEILGVDLNYFSDSFQQSDSVPKQTVSSTEQMPLSPKGEPKKNNHWDMSALNLLDSDFSGLKNLHEKFCATNMQRCLFIDSNLSGLMLSKNNIDGCDFTNSDISKSQIQSSNLSKCIFINASLNETEFLKSNISNCDFDGADFAGTAFKSSNFMKNTIINAKWQYTSFIEMNIQDIVFEGHLNDCFFENCSFHGVKFMNVTLTNTFFKNNKKFKKVQFVDCKADKITYAFLKSNLANLNGITIIP